MISGGNATVYVSNMDAAVRFYTEALGLKLTNRFGNHWATIEAGPSYWTTDDVGAGLVIGLHPHSPKYPAPGTKGAVGFGLETYEPIEGVIARLVQRGVGMTGEIIRFEAGNAVSFEDPDGTPTYLHEFPPEMVPPTDLAADEVSTEAGRNLVIGLHPRAPTSPAPGMKGSVMLGLTIDEPITHAVSRLVERGVRLTGDSVRSARDNFVEIEDLDGNAIYLWGVDAEPVGEHDLVSKGSTNR